MGYPARKFIRDFWFFTFCCRESLLRGQKQRFTKKLNIVSASLSFSVFLERHAFPSVCLRALSSLSFFQARPCPNNATRRNKQSFFEDRKKNLDSRMHWKHPTPSPRQLKVFEAFDCSRFLRWKSTYRSLLIFCFIAKIKQPEGQKIKTDIRLLNWILKLNLGIEKLKSILKNVKKNFEKTPIMVTRTRK